MSPSTSDPRAALDPLRLGSVARQLGIEPVRLVRATGSTNTDLAEAAAAGRAGHLAVLACEHQQGGKGRLGRGWIVPEGAALTVSVLVSPRPALDVPALSWYTMLAATAWCQAIDAATGLPAQIKWPNDVLIGARKVCGILAQLAAGPHGPAVVVGTGLNVDQDETELPVPTATSLRLAGGAPVDRTELLAEYLRRFTALDAAFRAAAGDAGRPLASFQMRSLRDLVAKRLATLGHQVRIEHPDGTTLEAQALNLARDGALEVRDAHGAMHRVLAGDVHHVRRADGQYA